MNDVARRGLKRGAIISGLLLLFGILGWAMFRPTDPTGKSDSYSAAVGGPFTLTDAAGRRFGSEQLRGRPFAIFFGFTRCPDVCPTTLSRMAQLRSRLGSDGERFQIVFVSVDPQSDTPEQIGRYLTLFNTPIIGLTGSPQELAEAQRAYHVYSERVPLQGGGYTMDHTATVFLMGSQGQFVSAIDMHENEDDALAKLRRLVRT